MQKLTTHYHRLLGLPTNCLVDALDFSVDSKRIQIYARFTGGAVVCSACGLAGNVYDRAPEQRCYHLETIQFESIIITRSPRCLCGVCGVKTLSVPWVECHSCFTLMIEDFAVNLLQHCSNAYVAPDMLELGGGMLTRRL